MKNQKKTRELIRQNEQSARKSQKHDANLQKNSTLYFQIGLILCLLGALSLLEMQVETSVSDVYVMKIPEDEVSTITNDKYKIYVEQKRIEKPEPKKLEKVLLTKKPKVVDNTYELEKALQIETAEQNTSSEDSMTPDSMGDLVDKPEVTDVPFEAVQIVPIYPGCEKAKK